MEVALQLASSFTALSPHNVSAQGDTQAQEIGSVSPREEVVEKNWASLGLSVLIAATMGGNVLVCIAVSWERRLQNMTNYFLMSLAIADLMVGTLVMPLALVVELYGYFPLGEEVCVLWASLDVLMCTASIWHMCTLSTDRYLTLKYPMKYGRNKTKVMVAIKIAFVWLVSIGISSPIVVMGFLDYSTVYVDGRCVPTSKSFVIYGSILAYFVPLIINIVTYALTMRILFHNQKLLGQALDSGGSGRLMRVHRLQGISGGGGGGGSQQQRRISRDCRSADRSSRLLAGLAPTLHHHHHHHRQLTSSSRAIPASASAAIAIIRRSRPRLSASDEETVSGGGGEGRPGGIGRGGDGRTMTSSSHYTSAMTAAGFATGSWPDEFDVDTDVVCGSGSPPRIACATQSSDEISDGGQRTYDDSSDVFSLSNMSQQFIAPAAFGSPVLDVGGVNAVNTFPTGAAAGAFLSSNKLTSTPATVVKYLPTTGCESESVRVNIAPAYFSSYQTFHGESTVLERPEDCVMTRDVSVNSVLSQHRCSIVDAGDLYDEVGDTNTAASRCKHQQNRSTTQTLKHGVEGGHLHQQHWLQMGRLQRALPLHAALDGSDATAPAVSTFSNAEDGDEDDDVFVDVRKKNKTRFWHRQRSQSENDGFLLQPHSNPIHRRRSLTTEKRVVSSDAVTISTTKTSYSKSTELIVAVKKALDSELIVNNKDYVCRDAAAKLLNNNHLVECAHPLQQAQATRAVHQSFDAVHKHHPEQQGMATDAAHCMMTTCHPATNGCAKSALTTTSSHIEKVVHSSFSHRLSSWRCFQQRMIARKSPEFQVTAAALTASAMKQNGKVPTTSATSHRTKNKRRQTVARRLSEGTTQNGKNTAVGTAGARPGIHHYRSHHRISSGGGGGGGGGGRKQHKILQGSAAKNERKALKVLGIIFTVFVVFWTPFFALNVASVICEPCIASLGAPAFTTIVWLGYVSSLANPVIYTMFNVHFRHAFANILTCRYRGTCARCMGAFDPTTDSVGHHLTNWATAGNRSTCNHGGSGDNVIDV